MASQEDDNKLQKYSNVNKEAERNFVNVYKKYECILNNKNEKFAKKIESLIEIWKSIGELQPNTDIRCIIQIMDWAKLHTLNIVLTGDWKAYKGKFESSLLSTIQASQSELLKLNDGFSRFFQKLFDVIKCPWDDPVLFNLLHDRNAPIGSKEIDFFCVETAYFVSMRLKKLCESQCEDLALNLVTAFMNCYNLSLTGNFNLNATQGQVLFCFDIHIALLYKYHKTSEIVALLKRLTLEKGLELIKRFAKKRIKISKVWKNYPEITCLASQVFVTSSVTKNIDVCRKILAELLETWCDFAVEYSMLEKLESSLRRIIQAATSAEHIYICCDVIHTKFGLRMKTFTIELYIRALTTDMNNLESQKNDKEFDKAAKTTTSLANGFYNLSEILKDNLQVSRECMLTSFSLEPTLERLRKIEELARLSGFNVLDTGQIWECRLHPPVSETDELCWICKTCGKWMTKPSLDLRLTTNFALNEALNSETLGIIPQLCDDLAVVLNGPRYQLLTWLLRWEDLHRLCQMYLNDMEHTKNLVTELKFVDIDYSIFATIKREPVDDLNGIERGYEKFLLLENEEFDREEDKEDEKAKDNQAKPTMSTLEVLEALKPAKSSTINPIKKLVSTSKNTTSSLDQHADKVPLVKEISKESKVTVNRKSSAKESVLAKDPPVPKHKRLLPDYNKSNKNTLKEDSIDSNTRKVSGVSATELKKRLLALQKARIFGKPHQTGKHHAHSFHCRKVADDSSLTSKLLVPPAKELEPAHPTLPQVIRNVPSTTPDSNLPTPDVASVPSSPIAKSSREVEATTSACANSDGTKSLRMFRPVSKKSKSPPLENGDSDESVDDVSKEDETCNDIDNLRCNNDEETINTERKSSNSEKAVDKNASASNQDSKKGEGKNHQQKKDAAGLRINPFSLAINRLKANGMKPFASGKGKVHKRWKQDKNFAKKYCHGDNAMPNEDVICLSDVEEDSISSDNSNFSRGKRKRRKGVKLLGSYGFLDDEHDVPFYDLTSDNPHTFSTNFPFNNNGSNRLGSKNNADNMKINPFTRLKNAGGDLPLPVAKRRRITEAEDKSSQALREKHMNAIDDNDVQIVSDAPIPSLKQKSLTENEDSEKKSANQREEVDEVDNDSFSIESEGKKIKVNSNMSCEEVSKLKQAAVDLTKDNLIVHGISEYSVRLSEKSDGSLEIDERSEKEVKIVLHKLSPEVIKTFVPDYDENESDKSCDCSDYKKRRRSCTCKIGNVSASRKSQRSQSPKYYFDGDDDDDDEDDDDDDDFDYYFKSGCKKSSIRNYKSRKEEKKRLRKDKNNESKKTSRIKVDSSMNPCVVLERLPLDNDYARSVLSNVPGLTNFEMMRPSNVEHIVNVVQLSGGRSTSGVSQNTQTSTQITPHIQRIGQPRNERNNDKPEHNSNSESIMTQSSTTTPTSTTTTTIVTTKPSTTAQPSTLINILSQQIIRPAQTQTNCVRSHRSSPLINILSQQIIRPATPQVTSKQTNQQTETQQANNKIVTENCTETKTITTTTTTTTVKNTTNNPSAGQGGSTILQFICKSTLPKFQQAFGKSVYQNTDSDSGSSCTENNSTSVNDNVANKKTTNKNSTVNLQPIQGGVIYTRQMPVGQAINLIPPGRGQVFRIAATSNTEQISLVKDTVIHSKMSALLAAALQGNKKSNSDSSGSEVDENHHSHSSTTRVTVTRQTLVQSARVVKPVLQIPSNVIRTSPQSSNLSSTTLEQLREFDMVYKQIKERSSTNTPSEQNTQTDNETSSSQRISVTYLNQQKYTQLSPVVVVSSYCQNLQPAAGSPALSVTSQGSSSPCVTPAPTTPSSTKVSPVKPSKGKTVKNSTTQASKASPTIPKPQQKPQEDEHTTQRIFDILAEYAEQLRNSPDLNNKPAPRRRSNPPTNPNQNSKRKKNSNSKKSGASSSMVSESDLDDHRTVGSEDSSCGVVQISVQDDEPSQSQSALVTSEASSVETTTTISNSRQQIILTETPNNQTRNLIIADSSVGEALKMPNTAVLVPGNYIMPVSMVKGGQQIAVVSGGSKILATVPARSGPNMLLFQSFLNQNRKSGTPTVKYSTIQPISGISSSSLAGITGQPPVILPPTAAAVTLGQPLTLKKVDDNDRVNTDLLLAVSKQPKDNGSGNSSSDSPADDSTNTITSTNIDLDDSVISDNSNSDKVYNYQKCTAPIATPVIAQAGKDNEEQTTNHNKILDQSKIERVKSVLVTACTSNGPMLSQTPPRYRKRSSEATTIVNNQSSTTNKEEFIHNGEKQNNNEPKFQGNITYYQNKNKNKLNPQRLNKEMHQLSLQRKQAAIERELRLQKSLSEECEDLGVDEPSTSDLFPEAELLFDSNHSPSFDSSTNIVKRSQQDVKEENKGGTLFSDDDSGSLKTDFLFETVSYQTSQQLTNGQSSGGSNGSGSSGEDNTLLPNCTSMSDVTLNSPVSLDVYTDNTPNLNKYKFKYSNRRKERNNQQSESWTGGEVSSSEDTTGSIDNKSASGSPEICMNKHSHSHGHSHSINCADDELSDGGGGGNYKVVTVAISKSDLLKDDESCEEHCEDDVDCSPSGRGARRSVKKMCSCCNGSSKTDEGSKKRSTSRPHTPAPHKKAFISKKR